MIERYDLTPPGQSVLRAIKHATSRP